MVIRSIRSFVPACCTLFSTHFLLNSMAVDSIPDVISGTFSVPIGNYLPAGGVPRKGKQQPLPGVGRNLGQNCMQPVVRPPDTGKHFLPGPKTDAPSGAWPHGNWVAELARVQVFTSVWRLELPQLLPINVDPWRTAGFLFDNFSSYHLNLTCNGGCVAAFITGHDSKSVNRTATRENQRWPK
jgi:hypothetical protein